MSDLTIYDIAEMAGVSAATVSKVLNGRRGVNAATAERVNRILNDTGFKPRWRAGGQGSCIGVVMPPFGGIFTDHYDSQIISGCYDRLVAENYSLLLFNYRHVGIAADGSCRLDTSAQLSGVIAVSCPENYDFCRRLLVESHRFPAVVIGGLSEEPLADTRLEPNNIVCDDYTSGFQAAMMLLRYNHRRILISAPSLKNFDHRRRVRGIIDAIATVPEAGYTLTEYSGYMWNNGEQLAVDLACRKDRPDALIFTNSINCAGFISGCHAMRLRVPEEFSVVGFEDGEELKYLMPSITAMHSPCEIIGARAVETLLAQITRQPMPPNSPVSHQLIMRRSVQRRD